MENENTQPAVTPVSDTPIAGSRRPRSKRPRSRWVWGLVSVFVAGCGFLVLSMTGVISGVPDISGILIDNGTSVPGQENVPLPETIIKAGTLREFSMDEAVKVKGLYLTMDTFGSPSRMGSILNFAKDHKGINAFVVDIKDNSGRIPCKPPDGISSVHANYGHFEGLVKELKKDGYYMIARIVAFQDPYMAKASPEMAIRRSDGGLWRDRDGRLWLNPYDERNWEFIKNIAFWAQGMGFDEIQLDYVRFPDSAQGLEKTGVLMPGSENYENRSQAIVAFLKYMRESLSGKAYLSADIFGFTTMAKDDMGIGQKIEDVASCVDFICPMVYPSHYYNAGIYGFSVPEAHPKEVVYKAMAEALERTNGLRAKIRPWLQDFSMRIKYGKDEVQGQIDAALDHGIQTYLLWNPANVYTQGVDFSKGTQ